MQVNQDNMERSHFALWSYKKTNNRSKAQNIPSIKAQNNAPQIQRKECPLRYKRHTEH